MTLRPVRPRLVRTSRASNRRRTRTSPRTGPRRPRPTPLRRPSRAAPDGTRRTPCRPFLRTSRVGADHATRSTAVLPVPRITSIIADRPLRPCTTDRAVTTLRTTGSDRATAPASRRPGYGRSRPPRTRRPRRTNRRLPRSIRGRIWSVATARERPGLRPLRSVVPGPVRITPALAES